MRTLYNTRTTPQLSFILCKFLIRVRPSQTSDNNYYGVAAVAFKFEFSGNASYPVAVVEIIVAKKLQQQKSGRKRVSRLRVCTVCRREVTLIYTTRDRR